MKTSEPYHNFNLKNFNTFRLTSYARAVYFPTSITDFEISAKDSEDFVVLGAGSNIILSSKGIKVPVLSTNRLEKVEFGKNFVSLGAGVKAPYISKICAEKGFGGFEFLSAIPCSIGGAVFMNASAHNQAISDIFENAVVWDKKNKKIIEFNKIDMDFSYRNTSLKSGNYVVLETRFKLEACKIEQIKENIARILEQRKLTQPTLKTPNAGSIFKNPYENSAGKLIEQAGLKGKTIGGAKISDIHANFIINKKNATSEDISELMFFAYNEVKKKFNIALEPEVIFVGEKSEKEEKIWKILQN